MMNNLKKYGLLYFYIYLSVWLSLASTPLNEPFDFTVQQNRMFSLLTYLPFVLLVLWKMIGDLRNLKKNVTNLVFYLFGFYYVALSGFRLLNGMEVKENIYYSVVLFGSVAAYLQIRDGRWRMNREDLAANLKGILVYMIVYKIIFTLLSENVCGIPRLLGNPPINNLYSTSMLAMLIPFLVDGIRRADNGEKRGNDLLLFLALILIATCKSRIIFHLGLFMYLALLVVNIRSKSFTRMLISGLCAVLVTSILVATNFAGARVAVNRATSLFPESEKHVETTQPVQDSAEKEDKPNKEQQKIEAQIQQSDNMRADLIKLALAEVRKNPMFGTGDLYYTYQMTYKTMEQTAHNFILESLVSVGLIGTAMIAVLLFSMLIAGGFFAWKKLTDWRAMAGAFAMLLYFFALGMVQPSVYNTLLCPLFAVLIAYYHWDFSSAEERSPVNVEKPK